MTSTDVSVVIRARDEALALPATIAAIRRQRFPGRVEIVVVNSGSTDRTVAIAEDGGARVAHLQTGYRPGLAVNVGLREARGRVAVLISAAAFPAGPDWLEPLVEPLLDAPPDDLAGTFGRHLPVPGVSTIEEPLIERLFGSSSSRAPFSFTNAAIRRDVWAAHPCDETIASGGGDDREWITRVIAAGYRVRYIPESMVHRSHGLTIEAWYSRMAADAGADRLITRAAGTPPAPSYSRGRLAIATLGHLMRARDWSSLARYPLVTVAVASGRWAGGRASAPPALGRAMVAAGRLDDRLFGVSARTHTRTAAFLRDYWAIRGEE